MAGSLKRRTLIAGGITGAAALAFGLRPSDHGKNHSPYFQAMSSALEQAQTGTPTLLIDKSKLLANVSTLKQHIGERFHYRVVAKSLPSIELLKTIMSAAQTERLMLFHQPFLSEVAQQLPTADVLMGKPMPINAVSNFYQTLGNSNFNPGTQLQWLLDTPTRLQQYAALAQSLEHSMRINIELDVGLHRGGVQNEQQLIDMLTIIQQNPKLQFAGFMGYEPHIVKVPGDPIDYRDRAMATYRGYIASAKVFLGDQWPDDVLLNCGGSPTYQLYNEGDYPFNELSAGSCLVKPTDFDMPSLMDHQAASYIATPVLKTQPELQLPVDGVGKLMSMWDPNRRQTFFTYGGYWKALPESPAGLSTNPLFGRSTNQEMLNGSNNINLKVDDWVFLRPTQSEFVFLQFGDIAVLDNNAIEEYWPVFNT